MSQVTSITPRCFMHVPKCGGSSVYASLAKALPPGSLSTKMMDAAILGPDFPDLESLSPRAREILVGTPEEVAELANDSVIAGHFRLSTLTQVARSESIGTILREPRARLLSQYVSWRIELRDNAPRFLPREYALGPLDEFLSDASLAYASDNLVCRMLLEPDPRIASQDFIASSDVETVALDAASKLDAFGFVGVLELGDRVWPGLSCLFGVALAPEQRNVTARRPRRSGAAPLARPFTARTSGLLDARTGADALVYQHVLTTAGCGAEDRLWLRDAAFANQLVALGDTAGHSAMWLAKLEQERHGN